MDVARADAIDAELDRLVERRSSRRPDPDERDERWKMSAAAYAAKRREANRQAWAAFHEGQAARHRAVLEDLIAHHTAEAERLGED